MNKYHEKLQQKAQALSNMHFLSCNLYINRRNGIYCVDKYDLENGKFIGTTFCGNFNETYQFLYGMQQAIWLQRPF